MYHEKKRSKLGIPRISNFHYPYIYRLGKVAMESTRLPIVAKAGHAVLDTKNSTLSFVPIYENLELPESTVAPFNIAEHFIREASHRFLMAYCPCRDANDCSDYPRDIGCIWIGGGTAEINAPPEVGRLVSADEAVEHLRRARDAGLITLLGKFRPDAMLMGVIKDHARFMTLCNCCPCCCMLKDLQYGRPEFLKILTRLQGLTVEVDSDKCKGCGECTKACLFGNVAVVNSKANISADCKGCGFCAAACPNEAISIKIEDPTFIEEAVSRISGAVDVTCCH
jgi:Pyruvate/2-oxoacid:ferredoxin oxidoreductase delta subunit